MKHSSLLIILFLLFSLAACDVARNRTSFTPDTTARYHEQVIPDTIKPVSWKDFFHDTVLQSIIQTTLENNKDLMSASARIEEAAAMASIARASLYPTAGYQLKAGGGKAGVDARKVGGGTDGGVFNGYGTLNWEVDLWGRLRAGRRSAIANYRSMIAAKGFLEVSLVAQVASQYFLLRDLDRRLEISKRTLESLDSYTKIISGRFDKGYIAEPDKLMAINQQADVAAGIPELERTIVQVENSIRLLMGGGPGPIQRGQFNTMDVLPADIPVGLPSQLLQRRPDIAVAAYNFQVQVEQVGIAHANRLPVLTVGGILGFASPQIGTLFSHSGFVVNGAGGITGPLFNFNQLKNRENIERQRTREAQYSYEQTVLGALSDVDNSLTYVRTYREEYAQRKLQTDVNTKALMLAKARYDNGYTSFLEVTVQQNNLFNAQLQESEALAGRLNAMVMLYKSLGGGW